MMPKNSTQMSFYPSSKGARVFLGALALLAFSSGADSVATAAPPSTSPSGAGLSLERLKAHYAGLTRLQADVEQTRTGRHLLKPFVSQIKLDYTPGVIMWNYVKPFVQTVKVSRDGFDLGQRTLPPAHSERLRSLTTLLDALFRMDLDAIRKDFDLKVEGDVVAASPRAGSPLKFVKGMDFEFDRKLDILSVTVSTETDSAVMKFSNTKVDR